MFLSSAGPFTGYRLERLKLFLNSCGLDYDDGIDYTVCIEDDDGIIATASLDGTTVKCVAVSSAHQGEDLTAQLLTAIYAEASRRGDRHLMLYTKPKNRLMFRDFGFYPVIETRDVLVLENRRDGLSGYLSAVRVEARGTVGCIVANCDPFTLGHRYLVETAAAECDLVYVFVLSEDKGAFPAKDRLELVRRGTEDLANVRVHPSSRYMISSATFPTYFLRDRADVNDIRCEVDIRLFADKIAPALGITRRYVGTEPFDPVTGRYNELLRSILPGCGVEVREIGRRTLQDTPISARTVRRLIGENRYDLLRGLVPQSTYEYLLNRRER